MDLSCHLAMRNKEKKYGDPQRKDAAFYDGVNAPFPTNGFRGGCFPGFIGFFSFGWRGAIFVCHLGGVLALVIGKSSCLYTELYKCLTDQGPKIIIKIKRART